MLLSKIHPVQNLVTDIFLSPIVVKVADRQILWLLKQSSHAIVPEPVFFSENDIILTTQDRPLWVVSSQLHTRCVHRFLVLWLRKKERASSVITPLSIRLLTEEIVGLRNWLMDNIVKTHKTTEKQHPITLELCSVVYLRTIGAIMDAFTRSMETNRAWNKTFCISVPDDSGFITTTVKDTPLGCFFNKQVVEYSITFRAINLPCPTLTLSK